MSKLDTNITESMMNTLAYLYEIESSSTDLDETKVNEIELDKKKLYHDMKVLLTKAINLTLEKEQFYVQHGNLLCD